MSLGITLFKFDNVASHLELTFYQKLNNRKKNISETRHFFCYKCHFRAILVNGGTWLVGEWVSEAKVVVVAVVLSWKSIAQRPWASSRPLLFTERTFLVPFKASCWNNPRESSFDKVKSHNSKSDTSPQAFHFLEMTWSSPKDRFFCDRGRILWY